MRYRFDYTFRALGSLFVITFFREDDRGLDAFVQSAFKRVSDFEKEFSRFVPDSSLSVLNRLGRSEVSSEFLELLRIAKDCFERSNGFFNPLFNVALLGYSHDFESGRFVPEILGSASRTDFENVRTEGMEVVLSEGMKLDFGAIGKWYLADLMAGFFRDSGYPDAVLNFGGDIRVIWNPQPGSRHRIAIASPFEEGGAFATVEVTDAGISSSGTYLRKWMVGNEEFRHIVFPTSVAAWEDCASVTVIDPLGSVSDAFATAIFAAGAKKGMEIALSAGTDALVVREDRKICTTPGFAEKYFLRTDFPSDGIAQSDVDE